MYVYIYIYVYVYVCVCIYVCMYVCMYIYMCMYMCVYTCVFFLFGLVKYIFRIPKSETRDFEMLQLSVELTGH